jgi:hypothetical protein
MLSELIKFILLHPIAVLIFVFTLAGLWTLASFIGVMPPLKEGAGWWARWGYACAQVFAGNIKAAAHVASQTRFAKQIESELMNADGSTLKQISTASVSGSSETVTKLAPTVNTPTVVQPVPQAVQPVSSTPVELSKP